MKFYALGLKGWVEIRKANKPPIARVSKAVVVTKAREYWHGGKIEDRERSRHYDYDRGASVYYRYDEVPKKLTLKTTNFTGGRLVKTIKASSFANRTQIGLRNGGIIELTQDLQEKLLGSSAANEEN